MPTVLGRQQIPQKHLRVWGKPPSFSETQTLLIKYSKVWTMVCKSWSNASSAWRIKAEDGSSGLLWVRSYMWAQPSLSTQCPLTAGPSSVQPSRSTKVGVSLTSESRLELSFWDGWTEVQGLCPHGDRWMAALTAPTWVLTAFILLTAICL